MSACVLLAVADETVARDLRSLAIVGLFELPTDTLAVPVRGARWCGSSSSVAVSEQLFNAMLPDTGGLYASSTKFASDKYLVMR